VLKRPGLKSPMSDFRKPWTWWRAPWSKIDFTVRPWPLLPRLATTLQCDRVSLGLTKGKHTKVQVMSHTADFGNRRTWSGHRRFHG